LLPALVFGAVNDIQLLFGGQVDEIDGEAGHPHHQNRGIFRFLSSLYVKLRLVIIIKLHVVYTLFLDGAEEGHQVFNIIFGRDHLRTQS